MSSTPLTDRMLDEIVSRLDWRGARSAAARHVGISRQNLGRILRERGVSRDSEVVLALLEFARAGRVKRERRVERAVEDRPAAAEEPLAGVGGSAPETLPTWIL